MAEIQWDKVGELLEEARKLPPEERAAYLEEACEEEAIREEVLSLLEAEEEAGGFFDGLASALPSVLDEEEPEPGASDPLNLEGGEIGRYGIKEHLGSGGMGAVYKARDTKLGRTVALKFLPPHLTAHPEAEERFVREARAAAALGHPNIATVYDIGETEEGRRFIAMAYYEGETLKEKLDREGTLPINEALSYAEQIAEALSRAHEAGIVHRDVKPANVMVTEAGDAKLLDFGLAKAAAETRLTEPGQQMGTAAYMSPEQAEGKEVDARTDLWALGALLYEMLAGRRPFEGVRKSAIIHSILHEEPTLLGELRSEVSSGLEEVVHRCLEKVPEERHSSAEALLEELHSLRSISDSTRPAARPLDQDRRSDKGWLVGSWHRRLVGGAATALLALTLAAIWGSWPAGPTDSLEQGPAEHSVAVLPFEVSGSGTEDWREGMVTALSLNLDGTTLRAIPSRTIFATLEERGQSEEGLGTREALEVAREVGTRYAIVGSALQLGEDLRLSGAVHRTDSGERLGRAEVRGSPDSAMALATDLTRKVLDVLLEKSEDQVPSVRLESITTESLAAFKKFLEGERHFRRAERERAANAFRAAVQHDSTFALAYARLVLSNWAWALGEGKQSMERAYELSDRLPRRERRLIRGLHLSIVQDRDKVAVDSLRRLTQTYPDDPTIWRSLGEVLWHNYVPRGQPEADRAFARATELDPGGAQSYVHSLQGAATVHHDSALFAKRVQSAPREWQSIVLSNSNFTWKEINWIPLALAFGDSTAQQGAFHRLDSTTVLDSTRMTVGGLAQLLFHPADLDARAELLRRSADEWGGKRMLVRTNILRGKINKALGQLQETRLQAQYPGYSNLLLARAASVGLPVPDSLLRAHLLPSQLEENPSTTQLKATGLYLIDTGREGELGPVLDRLQDRSSPDAQELKGYRAWKAGDLERVLQFWSDSNHAGRWGAIWRGDLYRELGRLEKAEGWYLAAWSHPVAHERLGQLYEEMGRPEEAGAAYERFIEAWTNADKPLQDRVQEARRRLNALGEKAVAE